MFNPDPFFAQLVDCVSYGTRDDIHAAVPFNHSLPRLLALGLPAAWPFDFDCNELAAVGDANQIRTSWRAEPNKPAANRNRAGVVAPNGQIRARAKAQQDGLLDLLFVHSNGFSHCPPCAQPVFDLVLVPRPTGAIPAPAAFAVYLPPKVPIDGVNLSRW